MADDAGPALEPPLLQRALALSAPLLLLQTGLITSSLVLLPALPLALLPSQLTRRAFLSLASAVQYAWFGMATLLLRACLGVRIVIYTNGKDEVHRILSGGAGESPSRDFLIIANHRTRLDWMFLWGLAAAIGRLSGFKIVLKDSLRKVPAFGWGTQCFAFPFMSRKDRDGDLATLRSACALHGGRGSLAMLLFPEGTDLSASNLAKSAAHSAKEGLPEYTQVLHPRTAGFVAVWEELRRVAEVGASPPPALLDITLAYVDYAPGERPDEKSVFLRGRACREVHVLLEEVPVPCASSGSAAAPEAAAAEVCRRLFASKEERLKRFYAPCVSGAAPDVEALATQHRHALFAVAGVRVAALSGVCAVACIELTAAFLAWRLGAWRAGAGLLGCFAAFVLAGAASGGIDRLLLGTGGGGGRAEPPDRAGKGKPAKAE